MHTSFRKYWNQSNFINVRECWRAHAMREQSHTVNLGCLFTYFILRFLTFSLTICNTVRMWLHETQVNPCMVWNVTWTLSHHVEDFFSELWRKPNALKMWFEKVQTSWHWWRHEILAWTSRLTFSSASSTSQCDISMTPVLSQSAANCSERTDEWHWRTHTTGTQYHRSARIFTTVLPLLYICVDYV